MRFLCPGEEALPTRLDQLAAGERLVVTAFRRWVVGAAQADHRQIERAWSELCFELGTHPARDAMLALSGMVTTLRRGARRPLRLLPPCCGQVTADEVALAALVAAAQGCDRAAPDGPGDARRRAAWLVRVEEAPGFAKLAGMLGATLSDGGALLPRRSADPPARTGTGLSLRSA